MIWTDLGLPLWRAKTLRDLASVLAARGEHDRAAAMAAEATTIVTEHGVHGTVEARW